MSKKWVLFILSGLFILSACSNQTPAPKEVKGHLPKKIDHIVVVIEENHSQQEIRGNPNAPYMNNLMANAANLTNYKAIEHPSQPNYLDLFSGSNQEVTNDKVPTKKFNTANLASELLDKHDSFKGYSEDLPVVGFDGKADSTGAYARKHSPWVNFTNVPKKANQPLRNFPKDFSQLPTVSFVIPNLENDMHDGSIKKADQWLKDHISGYVKWANKNNSLLIVTWDEDDSSQNNKIPTFFVGPMIQKGEFSNNADHFSLLRTIEDIYALPHAGKSKTASPILDIWKN